MGPGRKPLPDSEKANRGTLQPSRASGLVMAVEPEALPQKPEWLTAFGEEVWLEDVGRVSSNRLANERDSTMFAQYCNLQGAIVQAWRAGAVPAAALLMEARKMADQFGLFGTKSRIKGGTPPALAGNPFDRNGRR